MSKASIIDVSHLPTYGYGNRGLMWWGTWGLIVIEGTVFAIAIVAYFYLREFSESWPPSGAPPALFFGTLNTLILLASALPNHFTKKWARQENLRKVRIGLIASHAFALAFLVVRAFEFPALNTRWDTNAYGSIVYALMILHTIHLLTDVYDTIVLTVLMFTDKVEGRRFVDVSENSLYWYFVVASWIPIYATIYLAPRIL